MTDPLCRRASPAASETSPGRSPVSLWDLRGDGDRGGAVVAEVELDELDPRGDAELREHLVQVILDRPAREEEPRSDLRVAEALRDEAADRELLRGERVDGRPAAA